MKNRYSKLIITDSVLGIIFTVLYMYIYCCINVQPDDFGSSISLLAPIFFILIISNVSGVITYLHYRDIAGPLLVHACTIAISIMVLFVFGLITKIKVFYITIYGIMALFGILVGAFYIPAWITREIVYIAERKRSNRK